MLLSCSAGRNGSLAACANRDANLGAVKGGGLASLPLGPHAPRVERLTVPAVVPEDAVSFRYDMPALEITERVALA